jgi:hypothetical protein
MLSVGAIVGIVIGVIVGVAIIVGVVLMFSGVLGNKSVVLPEGKVRSVVPA